MVPVGLAHALGVTTDLCFTQFRLGDGPLRPEAKGLQRKFQWLPVSES
jgi:hypothetical protein